MNRFPLAGRSTAIVPFGFGGMILLALIVLLLAALAPAGEAHAQQRSPANRGLSLPFHAYFQSYTVDDPDAFVYRVRQGEYWILIARKFGVSYAELRNANPELWTLRGEIIRPGDEMAIPGLTAADQWPTEEYTVQPGDSWYAIADHFGVSFWDLRLDNLGLWSRRGEVIHPGDVMEIVNPAKTADFAVGGEVSEATAASTPAPAAEPESAPEEAAGEDAGAESMATPEPPVATEPGTLPTATSAGPPFRVTNPPADATIYSVRPGDSWFRIAGRYGMEFEKLRGANLELWALRGQNIRPADEMIIPAHGSPPPPIEVKEGPDDKDTPVSDSSYTVVEGDTWESVAEANGVTVEALKEANLEMASRELIPGDKVMIP